MSDKNFKVKNGIDSTGPVTITTPNTSTTGLIINVPAGGKSISFLRDGIERASIDDWGSFTTNGVNIVQPWWVRSPGIDTQSFFWVGAGSRSSVGIAGTNSGTNPVVYISQNGTATNDLTQWIKPDNTILAKIDYLGSIYNSGLVEIGRTKTSDGSSAINFITVGSYAGAGGQSTISRSSGYNGSLVLTNYGNGSIILNQGGTNILTITNTGSATFSSDLTVTGNFTVNGTTTNLNSTNLVVEDKNIIIADVATPTDTTADGAGITIKGATDKTFNWVESTGSFTSSEPLIINTNSTTRANLILKPIASQTSAVQEWQSSTGAVLANIDKSGYFRGPLVEVSPTNPGLYGVAIAANSSQTGDLFQITDSSNNAYTGVSSTGKFVTGNTANVSRFTQITDAALGQLTVYSPSASTKNIVVRANASQTADLQQWQNSSGTVLSSISSNGNLVSNISGTSTTFPIFVYTTASATTPYGIAIARQNRSDQYIHIHESDGSKAVIEAVAPNAAKPFFIKNKSNEGLYLGTNDTNRFSITSTGLIGVGIDTPSSAQMTLINSNSANTGLLVKGAASQTANLQEWQDSAGTVLVKVRASGQLNVGGAVAATTLGVLNIDPAWTALKVIGAASQTGNLQEWQNSAGIVLGSIASDGTTTLGYQYLTSGTHKIYGVTQILNNSSGTSSFSVLNPAWSGSSSFTMGTTATDNANNRNWQFVVGGGGYAGQSGNYIGEGGLILFENNPNDSSTTFRAGFRRGGQFALNSTYETYSANLSIKPISTSTIGIVIRANSSQTANLQEWQDSGGTTLAYVKDNGYSASIAQFAYIYTSAIQGWNGAGGSISFANALPIIITPQSASTVVLAIKGAASQTANLQEWQDSSGTVLSNINNVGAANFVRVGIGGATPSTVPLFVTSPNSTYIAAIVRGAPSQTANLTEWQDTSGAIRTSVSAFGVISHGNPAQIFQNSGGTDSRVSISTVIATATGIIIRGVASQSANLQEWQNSSGNTLGTMSAYGTFTAQNRMYAGWAAFGSGFGTGASASNVILIAKGAASQTANLQEWQNNSGTVLAKIDKDGIITVPAINVVGQSISSNITMIAGYRYFVDTSASRTLTLPSSATIGDEIQIFDSTNTAGTNNITINSNNGKIEGVVESYIIDVNGAAIVMTYTGSTYGWKVRM